MDESNSLLDAIESCLISSGLSEAGLEMVLGLVLGHFRCSAGTIHMLHESSEMLVLRAAKGVPESVLDRVRLVPIGKGMAGLAAERRQPIQVCNLQSDQSGVAKPAARETRMEGCIAVPMLIGGRVGGVIGVAKPVSYEFDRSEIERLLQIGSLIAKQLSRGTRHNPDPPEA